MFARFADCRWLGRVALIRISALLSLVLSPLASDLPPIFANISVLAEALRFVTLLPSTSYVAVIRQSLIVFRLYDGFSANL
jgi:hypothetical protein